MQTYKYKNATFPGYFSFNRHKDYAGIYEIVLMLKLKLTCEKVVFIKNQLESCAFHDFFYTIIVAAFFFIPEILYIVL